MRYSTPIPSNASLRTVFLHSLRFTFPFDRDPVRFVPPMGKSNSFRRIVPSIEIKRKLACKL